jgi:hypothetical protein
MDYRVGRINASTIRGVVTEYSIEGSDETVETPKGQELGMYEALSLEAAQMLAVKNGTTLRAVSIDGEPQMTTKDYRVGRINATIID